MALLWSQLSGTVATLSCGKGVFAKISFFKFVTKHKVIEPHKKLENMYVSLTLWDFIQHIDIFIFKQTVKGVLGKGMGHSATWMSRCNLKCSYGEFTIWNLLR